MLSRFRTGMLPVLLLMGLSTGCSQRARHVELLEARLRTQEQQLWQLQTRLEESQQELELASREQQLLRDQMQREGHTPLLPEHSQSFARTEGITLNKLFTGGKNDDGEPGDELLHVNLIPHDTDGDLVKIAGSVEIEVLDFSKSGSERQVGRWTFSSEEAAEKWRSGFLTSGYQFELPWRNPPTNENLTIHARFLTADGRQFDANLPVTIELPADTRFDFREHPYVRNEPPQESESSFRPAADEQLLLPPPPREFHTDHQVREFRPVGRKTTGSTDQQQVESLPPRIPDLDTLEIPLEIDPGVKVPAELHPAPSAEFPMPKLSADNKGLAPNEFPGGVGIPSMNAAVPGPSPFKSSPSLKSPQNALENPSPRDLKPAPDKPDAREAEGEVELKIQSLQEMKAARRPFVP